MKDEKKLTPRQAKFVSEYLIDGNAARAAVAAGYATSDAKHRGWKLLNHCEAVKRAIDNARNTITQQGVYNLEKAMTETEHAIAFAVSTKSASAIPRLLELRMKLHGLLKERHDVNVRRIDIASILREARARVYVEKDETPEEIPDEKAVKFFIE
jgi:phage terminase small subunit